ncbi:hypothetical protein N7462_001539 [Penicillium macrosclerotiorum]|uniref:uncharacterized protein n=1 Tax=Penicillium macrosclerotiorum TaxID=303699 RepID=UPI002548C53D|nr:uncharacterized protein N7462_001539 [Penicillium macrosclerotiorum]KAJ5692116.1 hypothetical protein N7462_001539 [Penicillium macrosclerotiorum]
MGLFRSALLGLFAIAAAVIAPAVIHMVQVHGIFLTPKQTVLGEGQGPIYIPDTIHCEDLHHYRPANLLFTACEDVKTTRFKWFPGLGHLDAESAGQGSIHVVDPKTFTSDRLAFKNFNGAFITHGIDVIADPDQDDAVYIFAVNHLPNPKYAQNTIPDTPAARSQIELFHHVLGSKTARHVRSIRHALIQTPNDIAALSPYSFYVTNDHFYRTGFLRLLEDVWPAAKWTNIIHIQLHQLQHTDPTGGLEATIAHSGLWNNNGLGHARTDSELVVSSAMGGELYLATRNLENTSIAVHTTIPIGTLTDNPSYFVDPYNSDTDDASGFVVAGISRAVTMPRTASDPDAMDPVQVWYARLGSDGWERKLLFEDDGSRIRTASAAVLVPVEPVGGVKRAWLFVTGFLSESMIAVEVDL